MHHGGGQTWVGRKWDALQWRFPWPLAFVAVLFYSICGMGQLAIGARFAADISASIEMSIGLDFVAEPDQSAVCLNRLTCRKAGSSADAAATRDPETLAQSAVVIGSRRV